MTTLRALLVFLLISACCRAEAAPGRAHLESGRILMFVGTLALAAGAITTLVGFAGSVCPALDGGSGYPCGPGTTFIAGVTTLSLGIATAGTGATLYAVGRHGLEPSPSPPLALTAPLFSARF